MGFVLGLDLGKKTDYSALSATQCFEQNGYPRFKVQGASRLPQGIPYPQQIALVGRMIAENPVLHGAAMAVDETGVGTAVIDIIRNAPLAKLVSIWPIWIHAGSVVREDPLTYCNYVPKRELVNTLSTMLEHSWIEFVQGINHEEIIKREVLIFSKKITPSGNESYACLREGEHDDLVLSIAMAVWLAVRKGLGSDTPPKVGDKGPVAQLPDEVWGPDDRPRNDPRFHGGRPPRDSGGIDFPKW